MKSAANRAPFANTTPNIAVNNQIWAGKYSDLNSLNFFMIIVTFCDGIARSPENNLHYLSSFFHLYARCARKLDAVNLYENLK